MYTIIWSFRTTADKRTEFERAYGRDGDWVRLFKRGKGYVRTELLFDGTRYLTIDRWETETDYRVFRKTFEKEYADLDKRFGNLTVEEIHIGSFADS